MNLIADAVAGGFLLAIRRPHLVLADMAAKAAWGIVTLLMVSIATIRFLIQLSAPAPLPPEAAGLVLSVRFVDAWPSFVAWLALICVVSFLMWSVLEAFVRSRILCWAWGEEFRGSGNFAGFLASGMVRRLVFGLTVIVLSIVLLGPALAVFRGEWGASWREVHWAVVTMVLLLVLVAFVLVVLDTLLRCDAVGTLGKHLGAIVATVATIGLFEVTLRMAAVAGTIVLVNLLPGPLVVVLMVPAIGVGLSVLHSYVLLVRYSAIGIMRNRLLTE